jgi:glycosyltransferase involved in cell wall biosynthesis
LREKVPEPATTAVRWPAIRMATYQFYPAVGGTERQAQELGSKLAEKGCEVKVLTARQSRSWPRRERLASPSNPTAPPLEVIRLFSPPVRGVRTLTYAASLGAYLVRHRHEYEIIHIHHMYYTAITVALLAPFLRKRVVCKVACAGVGGDMVRLRQRLPLLPLFLRLLRRIDAVVAISAEVRQELLDYGFPQERIVVIPNGVNTGYFSPGSAVDRDGREASPILFVGRLCEQKGVDILLRALALLGEQSTAWRLDLLGDGSDRPALQALAEESGIAAAVRFMGPRSDVRDRMRGAALLVLPSRYEGLSNVLLEAMACGLPVVATRVSGSVDVVKDGVNGLLVEPEQPEELAGAIQRLLQDRKLAQRLGEQARATVLDEYSLDTVADRYIALYRRLLGGAGTCVASAAS